MGVHWNKRKSSYIWGSLITEDNRCHAEIRSRIAMAKNAFNKKRELLEEFSKQKPKKTMVSVCIKCAVVCILNVVSNCRRQTKNRSSGNMDMEASWENKLHRPHIYRKGVIKSGRKTTVSQSHQRTSSQMDWSCDGWRYTPKRHPWRKNRLDDEQR